MRFTTTLLCCAFLITSAQAQTSDKIDTKHFDANHLIQLYKIKCDSLRISKKLKPLQSDSLLSKAAELHANYLMKNKTEGHMESISKMRTPFDRVEQIGGNDFTTVGENQLTTFLFTPVVFFYEKKEEPHIISTYSEAAQHLFDMFFFSKHHYENMIHKGFQFQGTAIIYDDGCKCIKMVEVFGAK